MNVMCRACLQTQKRFFNIFEHVRNNKLISDMLMELTAVKVQKDDGLPVTICLNCLNRLNSAYDFKTMVIESDIKLHNFHYNRENENNFLIKPEDTIVKVEEIDTSVHSNNKIIVVANTNIQIEKEADEERKIEPETLLNSSDHNQPTPNNKYKDNKECNNSCSNIECTHQKNGKAIDYQEQTEKKTLLNNRDHKNISVVDTVCNSNLANQCDQLIQENEIFLNDDFGKDLLTCNSEGSDWEFESKMDEKTNSKTSEDDKGSAATKGRKAHFCIACNSSFATQNYLNMHLQTHTGYKLFKCDKCGTGFPRRFLLEKHKAVHLDNKPYLCKICGKSYKSRTGLRHHKDIHSEQKLYTCSQCNKTFKVQNNLKNHLRRHQNDRNYVCEICGKAFNFAVGLKAHMLIHKGEKNVPCPECGKCFLSNGKMHQHLKQHLNKRPHPCSYCDARFSTKQILHNHQLIHRDEKPFVCKVCGKSFRLSCINEKSSSPTIHMMYLFYMYLSYF